MIEDSYLTVHYTSYYSDSNCHKSLNTLRMVLHTYNNGQSAVIIIETYYTMLSTALHAEKLICVICSVKSIQWLHNSNHIHCSIVSTSPHPIWPLYQETEGWAMGVQWPLSLGKTMYVLRLLVSQALHEHSQCKNICGCMLNWVYECLGKPSIVVPPPTHLKLRDTSSQELKWCL